jgi:4-amino-4-deoxychorismate lyase
MSIWINGRRGTVIDCRDRGLQYGDGLFETMRVRGGASGCSSYHLERLAEGCRRLEIDVPAAGLEREASGTRRGSASDGVLKLILTRGRGCARLSRPREERCTRVLSLHPLPPSRPLSKPVRVRLCRTRLGLNPDLAGLKTLNRLESVMARAEWRDERVWEG